MTLNQIH